uniref:Ribonuclease H protein At1g65750 family n=1 Tax=Cajanus cajan TaxID=3821 RepID=A0A151RN98_CAJCA|nr:Putative ribonuclease H protein At1g65750 family [Cajanus cajan]
MSFLWHVAHEGLLTNETRAAHGLTTTSTCPLCMQGVETTHHILRDCSLSREIWKRIPGGDLIMQPTRGNV